MKVTGWGALMCAAALTIACADTNRQATDENGNAAGTTGAYGDDDTAGRSAELENAADTEDSRSGASGAARGTSGQSQTRGAAAPRDTREFVRTAAMHGTAEVQLGELASERAQSQDVKAFGQMMVKDHTRANNELKQALSGQNVDVPNPELDQKHQQLLSRLRTLKGVEFDREYMMAMVEGHMTVRDLLQSRTDDRNTRTGATSTGQNARGGTSSSGQGATTHGGTNPGGATGTTGAGGDAKLDAAVNQWAQKTLPAVEQHLKRAQEISSTVK